VGRRIKLSTDIKPVSEFRANAAELIDHVKSSRRPLVLTQRGHSTAVVLDVAEYERMVEEIELLSDVRTAIQQIESGQGISNRDAKAELRKRFGR
jgi:antitoxin YefM